MPSGRNESVERSVQALGAELWAETQGGVPGVFDKQFWAVKLLDWSMQDPDFKVDLFRLVDVLPRDHAWQGTRPRQALVLDALTHESQTTRVKSLGEVATRR